MIVAGEPCPAKKFATALSTAFFFFQAEDGIRYYKVTGVQTCALPIYRLHVAAEFGDRLAGLLRQLLDVVAQTLDLVALVGDEIVPAQAGQAADAAGPVGVQLIAEILLEEFAAIHTMAF